MALFLAHGKLVYTFNQGQQRVKLRSQEKYNDGAWHNVSKSLSTIPHTHTHRDPPYCPGVTHMHVHVKR